MPFTNNVYIINFPSITRYNVAVSNWNPMIFIFPQEE